MLELAGPLAVAALVLAAGGLFKLRDPSATRSMWTALGVDHPATARVLAVGSGAVELALGTVTFLIGGRLAGVATAAAFLVFAGVAARLARWPTAASCGCFGRHSADATWLHVVVDASIAAVAAVAAVADAPGFVDARHELPGAGLAFGGLALVGAWLVVVCLTVLPETMVAARRSPRRPAVATFELRGTP